MMVAAGPFHSAASQVMNNEAQYFDVLSAGIAQIGADTFEARGVVYDRLWKIVVEQLHEAGDYSEESIARERAAFLAALQRIEFGARTAASAAAPTPVSEPAPVSEPPPAPGPAPEWAAASESAPAARAGEAFHFEQRPKRSMLSRIVFRMVAACAALLVIWFAYLVITMRLDSAAAARWAAEDASSSWYAPVMRTALSISNLFQRRATVPPTPAQRAVLYEESAATATGSTFSGQAFWRNQPAGKDAALSIDVEIPGKKLLLTIAVSRSAEAGSVISHLVEFRFSNPDRTLSEAVQDVLGILMKSDELSPGVELTGKVVRVRPGVFLMALSGLDADVGRNLTLLRERPWLDIPIVFQGGRRSLLAIEKGTSGQNAINELLQSGGQG